MKQRILALALAAVLAFGVTACGGSKGGSEAAKPADKPATETAAPAEGAGETAALPEIEAGVCQLPAIVTSIGQSADVDIVNTLCTKAGVEVTKNSSIAAADLTADTKTLILSVGGSSKGLGAAGIDADQELARTKELIAKAKELGITIVAMHTGGSARRGTLSDSFIDAVFPEADYAVVVSEGDTDGHMAGLLAPNSTPSAFVAQAADCLVTIKTVFGVQ